MLRARAMLMIPVLLTLVMLAIGSLVLLAQAAKAQGRAGLANAPVPDLTTNTSHPAPSPVCDVAWRIVSSPNPSSTTNYLHGIAAASANDVWAVGTFRGITRTQTLTIHWNGAQWSQVPTPNRGTTDSLLIGVGAVSSNDVWAVGYSHNGLLSTLVEHWDGSQWSIMPSPNPNPNNDNFLRSVSVVSSNDVWAVGYYIEVIGTFGYRRTLVEHWNGSQWSVVPSPNVGTQSNELQDVIAISTTDVWAVGYYAVFSGDNFPLIEHWDGSQWSIVPSPHPAGAIHSAVRGISAISHNDVWAVGGYQLMPGPAYTLIEHWNGNQWSIVPSPNAGLDASSLQDTSAISINDVWAVGYYCCGNDGLTTLVEHWDGVQWSIVPSPNPGTDNNYLFGVAAISSDDVWAAGYFRFGGGSPWQTLIEHYSLECSTPTPTPTAPTASSTPTITNTPTNTPSPNISTITPSPSPTIFRTSTPNPTSTSTLSTPTFTPLLTPIITSTHAPTQTPTSCSMSFTDVQPTDYFYEAVRYLYCRNVISGYGIQFRPYNNTTRGQMCKIVVLAEEWAINAQGGPHFTDVPVGSTFYPYVETAYNRGIVAGYGTEFRPNDNVTRGQLCKIIVLAQNWPVNTSGGPHFTDVLVGSTFYSYIETGYNRGIISGYGSLFKPNDPATRGQICKIVYLAVIQ